MRSLRVARFVLVALTLSTFAQAATPLDRARAGSPGSALARAGWSGMPRVRAGWATLPGFARPAVPAARRPAQSTRLWQSAMATLPPGHGAVAGIPDGAGGTYVAWEDFRGGVSDIYLLRVTSAGAVAGGWPASGVAVCNAPGAQVGPVLVSDGAVGVIVAWQDMRNGFFTGEGYAQRVSSAGGPQWTANGVQIVSGIQEFPSLASDALGGLLITWSDGSPGDIYVRKITSVGAIATGWNGIAVCSAADEQLNPVICEDNTGGAFVAWEDFRDGSGDSHVFAQRLNSNGAAQWTADGLQIDATTQASDPSIVPDGSGGAVLCWWDFDLTGMIRGQRVNSAGAPQWGAGTNMSGAILTGDQVEGISDGAGGMIAYWLSSDLSGGTALLAQHVNGAGANQWGSSAPSVASFSATEYMDGVDATSDGGGGALFTWMRGAFSQVGEDMRAQKIASNGSASWTAGGLTVKSNLNLSPATRIAPDGAGGAILSWIETDEVQFVTVKAQHYNSGGTAQLVAGGVNVFDDPGIQLGGGAISDGAGGAWTAWTEKSGAGNLDVKARHLTSGGASPGPTIAITTAGGDQILAGAVSDGAGGLIVAWRDRSGADDDISAQRLDAAGSKQWGASGVVVCNAVQDQALTSVVSDGANGAIFAWWDERNVSGDSNVDIFAQRVSSAGTALWGANGLGVCTNAGYQIEPTAVPVSGNGAMFLWTDYRAQPTIQIFGQVVNGAGAIQLAANGIALTTLSSFSNFDAAVTDGSNGAIVSISRIVLNFTTGLIDSSEFRALRFNGSGVAQWGAGVVAYHQPGFTLFPQMVADGTGGALMAWGDMRSGGTSDLYVQRITSAGAQSYGLGGALVCNAASWQWPSGLYATGSGDATVSWFDERAGLGDIYAQRIANTGTPSWTANGVLVCGAARGQYGGGGAPDNASGGVFAWTDYRSGTARYIYAQRLNNLGVPQWPTDGVVPVLISLVSSSARSDRVSIDWQISGAGPATVYRSANGTDWEARGRISPDASGRVAFEDRDVVPGSRYDYRIGLIDDGAEVLGGEVWVDVPAGFALRLRGFTPNPASGPLRVSFTLATRDPARLEILDVAGRIVLSRDLTGFDPGEHQLLVDHGVSPGVYFLRLHQGMRQVTLRAVAMR